jgi:hypothetical protein
MSGYDESYQRLIKKTKPCIDLQNDDHRKALLRWLNDWGCRQFAIKYHDLASNEMANWFEEAGKDLLYIDKSIMMLNENDLRIIKNSYSRLVTKIASKRQLKNGNITNVEFGPTGAAKIFFALRPATLIPWDDSIRVKLGYDGTAKSYCEYLLMANILLVELGIECKRNGFTLDDLPVKLNRRGSTLAKLIDEYYWVTVTRKCPAPKDNDIKIWVSWLEAAQLPAGADGSPIPR